MFDSFLYGFLASNTAPPSYVYKVCGTSLWPHSLTLRATQVCRGARKALGPFQERLPRPERAPEVRSGPEVPGIEPEVDLFSSNTALKHAKAMKIHRNPRLSGREMLKKHGVQA